MSRLFSGIPSRRRRDWSLRVEGALWAAVAIGAGYFVTAGAARWLF